MNLSGKTAVVTGGGGPGSGRAVSLRLSHAGAAVVIADVDEAGGRETARQVEAASGRATFARCDVAVESDVRALFERAGADVVVNCASAPYRPGAPMEYWLTTVEVDLLGALHVTRHAVDSMRRRGAGGAIVHFGSTSALGYGRKASGSPAYDVAKAGVHRIATGLGGLAREGIRVNALVPDWVATPEVKSYWDGLTTEQRRAAGAPDVLTTVEEIADAVLLLATDDSLAGRVMVWWSGQPRSLIPAGDPGYVSLEPR